MRLHYFKDMWNIFDVVLIVFSVGSLLMQYRANGDPRSSFSVIRICRIAKIFTAIKSAKSLRQIFKTFVVSLRPLTNIGSLLLLIMFIYAIVGVMLFG